MFFKKGVRKNLAKFTGNTCAKDFFIEADACNFIKNCGTGVFLSILQKFNLRTPLLYRSPPMAASKETKSGET